MNNMLTTRTTDTNTDANTMEFVMRRFLDRHCFVTLCRVTAITDSGLSIMPLLHAFTGSGDKVDGGTITGVPFFRLQSGVSAIIMDPFVGDIGLALICDRDISAIKQTGSAALPGSNRMHSLSDAVYLGGVLNQSPTQTIAFTDKIRITAPNGIVINGLEILPDGRLKLATGVIVDTHVHGGVESGGSTTSQPE
ncbi:oxidoreductase [Serratia quinivorans]|uniref:oxidoreductase n=1 Tax=Serratia quinivorans TaxID=137545 RepID=UPI003F958F0D